MYKVAYKQGSFVDYKGAQVNFILAAVSIPTNTVLVPVDNDGKPTGDGDWSIKTLSIGIAVQRPEDHWNEELGKKIAYGKALKRREHCLVTTDPGLVNTKMVEAVLEQEASYLQVNPGRYIAGYDDARDSYLEAKSKEEYLNGLTDEEKAALNIVARIPDRKKFLEAVDDKCKELSNNSTISNSINRKLSPVQN